MKRLEHHQVDGSQESLPQSQSQLPDDPSQESKHTLVQPSFESGNKPSPSASGSQLGRLLIDETQSFYIGSSMLTRLLDEVRMTLFEPRKSLCFEYVGLTIHQDRGNARYT